MIVKVGKSVTVDNRVIAGEGVAEGRAVFTSFGSKNLHAEIITSRTPRIVAFFEFIMLATFYAGLSGLIWNDGCNDSNQCTETRPAHQRNHVDIHQI